MMRSHSGRSRAGFWWVIWDLNPVPVSYEPAALTKQANDLCIASCLFCVGSADGVGKKTNDSIVIDAIKNRVQRTLLED